MLAKTGLLVVSNPKHIERVLCGIQKNVRSTLYIQLLSALSEPFGAFCGNVFTSWPKYSSTITGIYSEAAIHCKDLDVRVLLSGLKYNIPKIQTQNSIDLIIFDKIHKQQEIDSFIKCKISNITKEYKVITVDTGNCEINLDAGAKAESDKIYSHSVLGGTFDRLHIAHKLLLTEAVLRTDKKLTVGITDEKMLENKLLSELIEDYNTRKENVEKFLNDICPEIQYDVVSISDAFGPSVVDPTMDLLIVSDETLKGGQKVNEVRQKNNLAQLHVHPVQLIDEPDRNPIEEPKISSSTARIRLLGTLLKPVQKNVNIPLKPYVIGLTGTIASGKSGVANWMSKLGAEIIDCDKIGHSIYKNGKPCHKTLVDHFGNEILDENQEIDRKKLGAIVFGSPQQLEKLNSLVWPAMLDEIKELIQKSKAEVVVIEAAILSQAGWDKNCHEVWTTIITKDEAVRRLKERNGLSEEQALSRINSQKSTKEYVNASNVVFCTLWPKEYTGQQVQKAWDLLQGRINDC